MLDLKAPNSYKSIRLAPLKTPAIKNNAGAIRYTFALTDVCLCLLLCKGKSILLSKSCC